MNTFNLEYISKRNISLDPSNSSQPKVLTGFTGAANIIGLSTNLNVRDMIADDKKEYTPVHHRIWETLEQCPERFPYLNGGITILAKAAREDGRYSIALDGASIINGAQTQGVLKDWVDNGNSLDGVFIKYEAIIIPQDDDEGESLAGDISVARNQQNKVEFISLLGTQKHLEELELSMLSFDGSWKIRKRETDPDTLIDTGTLIQTIVALLPNELIADFSPLPDSPQPYPWQSANLAKSLRLFEHSVLDSKNASPKRPGLYEYMVQIAPHAWSVYQQWREDPTWKKTGIKSGKVHYSKNGNRDIGGGPTKGRKKLDVQPDGIIFPVLSGLSIFCTKKASGWTIHIPSDFGKEEYMREVELVYKKSKSDPSRMGRNSSSYLALQEKAKTQLERILDKRKIAELEKRLARRSS